MIFNYQISAIFRRKHFNPPHQDQHHHDFRVTLHLQAERHSGQTYGLDMCELEELLKSACDRIPELVNQLIPDGTTEQMCIWFVSNIDLPEGIKLSQVDVSETEERVTSLVCSRPNRNY